MSLLRLLTSGKTLIGLKRSENRYQLPGGRTLPSFGSKKNPFRATVFPEKADAGPGAAEEVAPEVSANGKVSGSGNSAGQTPTTESSPHTNSNPCAAVPATPAETPETAPASKVPSRRGGALRALLLWSRVRKPKLHGPFKGRPLVQAELLLESVKVVRNDLTETDLEIVRAGREPRRSESDKPHSAAGPNSEAPLADWSATGGQLLSAGKM